MASDTTASHRTAIVLSILVGVLVFVPAIWWLATHGPETQRTAAAARLPEPDAGAANPVPQTVPSPVDAKFAPPPADEIPQGPYGDVVRRGRDLFVDTQANAKQYVGNGLNCVNCHLDAGRKADSAPLWAAYTKYPAYRDKNKKVNSYEDRLAGCFTFSMNGKSPSYDSPEMVALVTYSYWLATGAPVGKDLPGRGYPALKKAAQPPDVQRGATVFTARCAICHGSDGAGTRVGGAYQFPPLWGPDSYNGGAGMHRVETAAAFIQGNMPLGQGRTLSEQEAWDVAAFVNSHDRPPDPRKTR